MLTTLSSGASVILGILLLTTSAKAANIDVSQYSRLYVSYQNCVWSPYANGCGQQEDGNYWYTAFSPCYRANAAYTLYGIPLSSESSANSDNDACSKANFVGSYFTTNGIDDFLDALAEAGAQLSGENDDEDQDNGGCEIVNQGDGEEEGNEEGDQQAVDYTANNRKMYSSTQSTGLGCTADHQFAVKTYSGAYCDERSVIQVTDTLETFNQELEENVQCILVYDAAANQQQNGNEEGDEEQNGEQAGYNVDFLGYSEACNVRLYPNSCPDPYGRLHSDARAVGQSMQKGRRGSVVKTVFSWILLVLGSLFMGASAWACYNKSNRTDSRSSNASSGSSSKTSRWRAQPFKRSNNEAVPEQAQAQATTAKAGNKKRRFWRLFSRRGS